jgi:hypothetical protein
MMVRETKQICCNYRDASLVARRGAQAWVLNPDYDRGSDRILILVRSRSGRWIEKWEFMKGLTNFRLKTVVPEDPLSCRMWQHNFDERTGQVLVDRLNAIAGLSRTFEGWRS